MPTQKKYIEEQGNSSNAKEVVGEGSTRCTNFLVELCQQVGKRLPDNEKLVCGLNNLNPRIVLSQMDRPLLVSLPMLHIARNVTVVDEQYHQILHVNWASEEVFGGNIPSDAVDFGQVYTDMKQDQGTGNLTILLFMHRLCLPLQQVMPSAKEYFLSSKTTSRNSMKVPMFDAIIRIRSCLKMRGNCCKDFKPTPKMLELFNSESMRQDSCEEVEITCFDNF